MADRVLIDTCVWANVFAKPESPENRTVGQLIEEDRVVLIGPVLSEVLVGFRRSEQADWAASRLKKLDWIAVDWDDWREAAALGRQLAATG
jgi:predicted nucleic acid-binding protein